MRCLQTSRIGAMRVAFAALAVAVLLAACGGSDDPPSTAPASATPSSDSGTALTSDDDDTGVAANDGSQLAGLIGDPAFAGGNDDGSIGAAVAAFNAAGADFSPEGLASNIPDDCERIDEATIGEIIGTGVSIQQFSGDFIDNVPGYLNCSVKSTEDPDVGLGSIYVAPDENGRENWVVIGTMDGAFAIDGLGDSARWSDGSGGTNLTNKTRLQLEVTPGGTQSYITGINNAPQQELVGEWTIPKLMLALAVATENLTS